MKIKAIQGYLMAFNFMQCYKEENTLTDDLRHLNYHLELILSSYKRKNINLRKNLKVGWEFFGNYVQDQEKPVSILAFIVQLIIKNPDKEKYKALTNKAFELNKQKQFTKDSLIFDAKVLVNRFYGLIKD